jgi:mannose-1-phosphate guanylyltransferase / mannose-6-phosphate isomerase
MPPIVPVILSGGSGSRLWPLSRQLYPKQLLPLVGTRTMLQETALRVSDAALFTAPVVICNDAHRFVIAEQMREAGIEPMAIVLEPVGRNTAAAAAVGAILAAGHAPDSLVLLLPADHHIGNASALRDAFAKAAEAASAGHLVTFGIHPTTPETGYGYIRSIGEALPGGAERVARFVEKPPREVAEQMLAEGGHTWNSGMFLFQASAYLAELERFEPKIVETSRRSLEAGRRDLDFLRLDESFADQPSLPIDTAVMERTDKAAVLPLSAEWTDLGSWSSLWEIGGKDRDGNVVLGDAVLQGTRNSYVRSEDRLTAVVGLQDVIVVTTPDAVLVASREAAQDVKAVVDLLARAKREEVTTHRRVHRPWGWYEGLSLGDRYQVKCLSVKPGCKLSLQKHFHRAEHWVVVKGTALVTRDDDQVMVRENESIYLPLGCVHRLENPGRIDLQLIEVQSGPYLGEDDIVRFEDDYKRC